MRRTVELAAALLTVACLSPANPTTAAPQPAAAPAAAGPVSLAPVPNVIRGVPADRAKTPWFVSWYPGDGGHCGGTIIAARWILTAAHCATGTANSTNVVVRVNPARMGVGPTWTVDRMIIHSGFVPGGSLPNDIALLHVNRDLPAARMPLNLSSATPKKGQDVMVFGFGAYSPTGELSTYLRRGLVRDLSGATTGARCGGYPASRFKPSIQICAGRPELKRDSCGGDSGGDVGCGGDSGGPLLQLINRRWTQVGIVSSGGDRCNGNPDQPGVYTRVSTYRNWISAAMTGPQLVLKTPAGCTLPELYCMDLKKGSTVTLNLSNPGGGTAGWRLVKDADITASAVSGTLASGKSVSVTLTVNSTRKACSTLAVIGTRMLPKELKLVLNGDEEFNCPAKV